MAVPKAKKYLTEEFMEGLNGTYELENIIYTQRSEFQIVEVVDLKPYGRTLLIDGKIQSTEKDEVIYHEYLVHPALMAHPNPKTVMICGGGEGATAKEILRHKTVEKVIMVDIDNTVIEVSKKFFPNHHRGVFENPKFELVIQDARKYLEDHHGKFDVIIMDLSDPLEDGPAYLLYTQEFYKMASSKLNENGLIVTHSGPAGLLTAAADSSYGPAVYNSMKSAYKHTIASTVHMFSFLDIYSIVIGTNSDAVKANFEDWQSLDARIEARLDARHELGATEADIGGNTLRCYDAESHQQMRHLPKWYRKLLRESTVTITDSAPRFYTPAAVSSE